MTPALPRHLAAISLAAAILFLLSAAPARAATSHLWATVNICDTPKYPDKMGVRGRMPGNGKRQRMYMRFYAQYRTEGTWRTLEPRGRSPRYYAGSALFRYQELGYTFDVEVPDGDQVVLRGIVKFEWRDRSGNRVLKRARRETTSGHRSVGADPRNVSAARCTIEGEPVIQPTPRAAAGPQARLESPPVFR